MKAKSAKTIENKRANSAGKKRIAKPQSAKKNAKAVKGEYDFDLKELRAQQKKNFLERLKFIDSYVEWLKRTPNKVWSKQQNVIINQNI